MSNDIPSDETPLLTISEVEAWQTELSLLEQELDAKRRRADWLRHALASARILLKAKRDEPK
jgi:hypothetical protein